MIELLIDYLPIAMPTADELAKKVRAGDALVVITMYDKPTHVVILPGRLADRYTREILSPMLASMGFGSEVGIHIGDIGLN